jgi:hypothetical protein
MVGLTIYIELSLSLSLSLYLSLSLSLSVSLLTVIYKTTHPRRHTYILYQYGKKIPSGKPEQ